MELCVSWLQIYAEAANNFNAKSLLMALCDSSQCIQYGQTFQCDNVYIVLWFSVVLMIMLDFLHWECNRVVKNLAQINA